MSPILHLFCGRIAAGKSTFAKRLSRHSDALLISEDDWMSALYGPELKSFDDYVRYSARLRSAVGPHIVSLLQSGRSVALDFPANTKYLRRWMRAMAEEAGAPALLHFLALPETACKERLKARNAAGRHAFAVSEAEFDLISARFEEPSNEEGIPILVHAGL